MNQMHHFMNQLSANILALAARVKRKRKTDLALPCDRWRRRQRVEEESPTKAMRMPRSGNEEDYVNLFYTNLR